MLGTQWCLASTVCLMPQLLCNVFRPHDGTQSVSDNVFHGVAISPLQCAVQADAECFCFVMSNQRCEEDIAKSKWRNGSCAVSFFQLLCDWHNTLDVAESNTQQNSIGKKFSCQQLAGPEKKKQKSRFTFVLASSHQSSFLGAETAMSKCLRLPSCCFLSSN